MQEVGVSSTYNFTIPNNLDLNVLMEQVEFIYEHNKNAFKINISFDLLLQNINDNTYR